jgi:hypothetical protein
MRAIFISSYGAPEVLVETSCLNQCLSKARCWSGSRHSASTIPSAISAAARGGEVAKVTGIECAGVVDTHPAGTVAPGPGSSPFSEAWAGPGTEATRSW